MNTPQFDPLRKTLEDLKSKKDTQGLLELKREIKTAIQENEKAIQSREGNMEGYVNQSVFLIKSLILVTRCQRDVRILLESCG